MRRISLPVLLLLCAVLLTACVVPAPPTPDISPTRTAMAEAIRGTGTALAPTRTPTAPAGTPPQATPVRTPTPTPAAVDVPAHWAQYNAFTELFSFYYPPTWDIDHESVNEVRLYADDASGIILGVYETFCGIEDGVTPEEETLICLAATVSDEMGMYGRYRHIAKERWAGEVHQGYAIEHILYMPDDGDDEPVFQIRIFVPVADGLLIDCVYFHRGTRFITDQEHRTLQRIIDSFRIRKQYIPTPTLIYDGISSVS